MRIAVVGTGISGLGAALLLAPKHDPRVFERETRIGGHTHTRRVDGPRGSVAVDSGGSRTYVEAMLGRLNGRVHTGLPVRAVTRTKGYCRLHFADGAPGAIEHLVGVATQYHEALRFG